MTLDSGRRFRRRPLASRLFIAGAAGGLFLLGYQWGNQWEGRHAQPPAIEGVRLRPPAPMPSWQLEDASGESVDSTGLKGFWLLLGFASVDDPSGRRTLTRMLEVFNRLADRPDLREQLRLVLVSARSDLDLARDFQRLPAPTLILSGSAEQLAPLRAILATPASETKPLPRADETSELGRSAPKSAPDSDFSDAVREKQRDARSAVDDAAQPAALHLIDPKATLIAVFPAAQSPTGIARDIRALTKAAAREP